MSNTVIPATRNEGWGFWGTMGGHACIAWPLAMTAVTGTTGADLDAFLDSRFGRHFADEVHNGLFDGKSMKDAIEAATTEWMGWTIGRQSSKDYGIPRGLPYLTGYVIHCGIVAEQEAA